VRLERSSRLETGIMDGIVGQSRPEHFRTLGYHDGPFIFSSLNDVVSIILFQ
jgi:hypothetical protein